MDSWELLFNELYGKIKPISGSINHQIGTNFKDYFPIVDLWINLTTEGYTYKNPELQQVEDLDKYNMEIDLRRGDHESLIKNSILDLQNQTYNLPYNELIGVHSHEIYFSIPECKFGKIESGLIDFEMNYILDSHFGHLTQQSNKLRSELKSGVLKTKLKVSDLRVVVKRGRNLNTILKKLDSKYDVENYYLDESINYTNMDYEVYNIPVRV